MDKILSIIMPIYNQPVLVIRALDSIPRRDDIEIICIDDMSSDNTYDILKEYKKNSSLDIILLRNEVNSGIAFTTNKGLDIAKGKWITDIDNDDYLLTDNYNKIIDMLPSLEDYDFVWVGNRVERNHNEIWYGEDRLAMWTYMAKKDFIGDTRFPLGRYRDADARYTWALEAKNPKMYNPKICAYHYNWPRKGSVEWTGIHNYKEYGNKLKEWYKNYTGKELNLESPKTFNEKMQWLKLYDSTEFKGKLADKYESRQWLKDELGKDYSVKILGVWDRFDDIDFSKLPNKFILKATHGSGWNIIVKDKSKLNVSDAKKKFNSWLNTNYAFVMGYELHYLFIKPRIIAEEYLGDNLIDYRFYCYNGDPKEVWVDKYSGTQNHKRTIYDINWNEKEFLCAWPRLDENISKPVNFDLMRKISKTISKYFRFVRVDFFEVDSKMYLGEITFIPLSGIGKYIPESYDLIEGELLKL